MTKSPLLNSRNTAPTYRLGWQSAGRIALLGVMLSILGVAAPGCRALPAPRFPAPGESRTRAQLSIGYSLLYQEANGIPKLKWLLMFKDKPEPVSRAVNDLVAFYQQLAEHLKRLTTEYPAVRLDAPTMSEIEGATRKAIGEDLAKDIAPLIGETGIPFERKTLLTFYDALNEQRHLTGVMIGLETDAGLRKFLELTKAQLDERYAKVGALLERRYFTH